MISLLCFQQFKKVGGIAAAACGKLDEAEAFYEAALKEAADIPMRLEQAEVRRWYAKMLIGRKGEGDRAKARQLLDEAFDVYRAIGMPRHLEMAKELAAKL
ncbi:MAG: hypothetical protein E2P02_18510 [Acidobacteria bacterium]|nr:MAG: hypothetical protein E2P02_18510 [Acidobacteriota bacterium]